MKHSQKVFAWRIIMLKRKEMSSLLTVLITTKLLLTYPRKIILHSENAAWLQLLLSTILAFLLFRICMYFYAKKASIIELAQAKGGRPARIVVGLLVFAVFGANLIYVTRLFPQSVKISLLQNFDEKTIIVIFAASLAAGAFADANATAKISCIFLPIAGLVTAAFLIFLIPNYRLYNIVPILGKGAGAVLGGAVDSLSIFSDLLVLNAIMSYSKNLDSVTKSGGRAIIISGITGAVILAAYTMIYPYPISAEFFMPVYQMTRIIDLGGFINRFEALFEFVWAILILLYGCAYLFALTYVWQQTFDLRYRKPLIVPIMLVVTACALLPDSVSGMVRFIGGMQWFALPIVFLLPILMAVLTRERKRL